MDPLQSDEDVVAAHVKQLPPALRLAGGPDLKKFLLAVVLRERARCAELTLRHAAAHQRAGHGQAVSVLSELSRELTLAPGACRRCRGAKVVASGIVNQAGQALGVACPACASPPAAAPGSAG